MKWEERNRVGREDETVGRRDGDKVSEGRRRGAGEGGIK